MTEGSGLTGRREGMRLAGYCGLYCGNCDVFRAWEERDAEFLKSEAEEDHIPVEEVKCEGCKSDEVMYWCRKCEIKRCASEKGIDFCCECLEFPCALILRFQRSQPHHGPVLANMRAIEDEGIDVWLNNQNTRWRCPS
ncbi:MAG: DUF3795 domain-containing protein, partial [Euryarchaeota archaeon]|nr:DUF3795 domain-containing protein [Euryarchaeota archaeon]